MPVVTKFQSRLALFEHDARRRQRARRQQHGRHAQPERRLVGDHLRRGRTEPSSGYFEPLAHPPSITPYTAIDAARAR